jgi:sugar-specific transcriptional regulator TrmB
MGFIEDLTEYGLTRQEATIYARLLRQGSMTGYEVAKDTGISKSNVYVALKELVQKGAAVVEEGDVTRYLAVDVERFCEDYRRYLETIAGRLIKEQPERSDIQEGYITISTDRHIRDCILDMLSKCEKRVYFLAESSLLEEFKDELSKLILEKKKVVVLTDENFELEGAVIYRIKNEEGQIRFITDSSFVLTGDYTGSEDDTCLYSGKKNLVELVKETIKNRISIIQSNNI